MLYNISSHNCIGRRGEARIKRERSESEFCDKDKEEEVEGSERKNLLIMESLSYFASRPTLTPTFVALKNV